MLASGTFPAWAQTRAIPRDIANCEIKIGDGKWPCSGFSWDWSDDHRRVTFTAGRDGSIFTIHLHMVSASTTANDVVMFALGRIETSISGLRGEYRADGGCAIRLNRSDRFLSADCGGRYHPNADSAETTSTLFSLSVRSPTNAGTVIDRRDLR
ncbi:MAG: hypothetical protein J0H01_08450 [Rhizobiales bacterium]|nr:hypothetical protein [Hyphomicrobiales bacterium]